MELNARYINSDLPLRSPLSSPADEINFINDKMDALVSSQAFVNYID